MFKNTQAVINSYLQHIDHPDLKASIQGALEGVSSDYARCLSKAIMKCKASFPDINSNYRLLTLLEKMAHDTAAMDKLEALELMVSSLIPQQLSDEQKKFLRDVVIHPAFYCYGDDGVRQAFVGQAAESQGQGKYMLKLCKFMSTHDNSYYFDIHTYNYRTSSLAKEQIRVGVKGDVRLPSGKRLWHINDVLKDCLISSDYQPLITMKPEYLIPVLLDALGVMELADAGHDNQAACANQSALADGVVSERGLSIHP